MADDITYTSSSAAGPPDATKQVTDEHATRGHMPVVKVAYSADGVATLVQVDADGMLVNLGANNDVVVSDGGGSVTVDGTVTVQDGGGSLTVDGTVTAVHGITGIGDGRKVVTTAGTPVALAASTTCKRVVVVAETDNTGTIVVGGTGVVAALGTRRGVPLGPGDAFELDVDDLADVWIDSTVSTDGVTFTYLT